MVEAIEHIMAARHDQLDNGYSLDRDMGQADSERRLLAKAIREAGYTQENITLRVGGQEWMDMAIRRAAKSAGLLLAFIELLMERQTQQQLEPEPVPVEQQRLDL
ncbi:MAG: hypothetical protein ABJF09_00630 [Qipengyuania citrea]